MQEVFKSPDVKKIIPNLENDQKYHLRLKAGNHRQRRTYAQMTKSDGADIAEVYSPPRVAEVARERGMREGFSLDLTTVDENGEAWDFSNPKMKAKARQLVDERQPELLISCPMCGPFGTWLNISYANVSDNEARNM